MSAEGRRQDHYEVLGVREDATDEVIRAAYRALAAKYHPDRNPGDGNAELKLKRLNAAFEVLGNPEKKRLYDELTQSPQANESHEASRNDDPRATGPGSRPISQKALPTFVLAIGIILGGASLSGALALESPALGVLGILVTLLGSAWVARVRRNGRVFLTVFGSLVLAFLVVIGSFLWYDKVQSVAHEAEQAAVTVEATYDPIACTQEKPILVVVTNGSARTLKSVSFALRAFEKGISSDLAVDSANLESDAIVQPGGVAKRCRKFPLLSHNASVFFRAEKDHATFYEANEFIPRTESESSSTALGAITAPWVWTTEFDYQIAFPDTPRPAEHSTESTRWGTAHTTTIELSRPSGAAYWVQKTEYPSGSNVNEQGSVEGSLKGLEAVAHEVPQVLSDRRAMIGNCNGRAYLAAVKGYSIQCLACVSGSRGYWAIAAVPTNAGAGVASEAESFLASLSISPPPAAARAQPIANGPGAASASMETLCSQSALCAHCLQRYPKDNCYDYLRPSPTTPAAEAAVPNLPSLPNLATLPP